MTCAKISHPSDASILIEFSEPDANAQVHSLFRALLEENLRAVENFHPAYQSLLVDFDPSLASASDLQKLIEAVAGKISARPSSRNSGKTIEVPVAYGGDAGPDLASLARATGMDESEIIKKHSGVEYTVAFLGFAPGFPYLLGLPKELECPRLSEPRLRVSRGSVAIGGAQTGIYPEDSPGGWQLIGRTELELFDPRRKPAALFSPGDRVRFRAVKQSAAIARAKTASPPSVKTTAEVLEVVSGGFYSTIQDLGRRHQAHLGVARAGAADPIALRIGNRLVGNEDGAAAIEMTSMGGSFRFLDDAWIAVTGASATATADGQTLAPWTSFPVRRGQTLLVGALEHGMRAYLCIHGGIGVEPLLESRSTFVSGGWGGLDGRELRGGDRIHRGDQARGPAGYRRANSAIRRIYNETDCVLRVVRGPQWDWFTPAAHAEFFAKAMSITGDANRRGLRLSGPSLPYKSELQDRELVTEGVANGAIQVPQGGQPLLLFCEQQTTGGYAKIANVIRADWFRIGQLKPGGKILFQLTDLDQAWRINAAFEKLIESSVMPI